jgi:hypothetical protein
VYFPHWLHATGVLFNHLTELAPVPWLIWIPLRSVRHLGGVVLVLFQMCLILSGNLSFLNYLTILPCLACFDDSFWWQWRLVPTSWKRLYQQQVLDPLSQESNTPSTSNSTSTSTSTSSTSVPTRKVQKGLKLNRKVEWLSWVLQGGLLLLVGWLSVAPVANLISSQQIMNTSFDPFRIVNTYGAFGSVGEVS